MKTPRGAISQPGHPGHDIDGRAAEMLATTTHEPAMDRGRGGRWLRASPVSSSETRPTDEVLVIDSDGFTSLTWLDGGGRLWQRAGQRAQQAGLIGVGPDITIQRR